MKKLLALAIFLRLLLAVFYFHPDIKTYHFQASFLKKGVFNIYSYLEENKKALPLKEGFVYFPLTYFALGGYQAIVSPFLGSGFDSWLGSAESNSVVREPSIFKYLLVIKLPYLVLDILIAFILMKFFESEKEKKKAFLIWLFNPFTPILIYVFGNIDIMPVILTLLALILAKKEKLLLASVLFGLAAGFKLYPLLFVPFLALKGENLKEKMLLAIAPLLTLGAITLPFWSSAFVSSALVSGLTTRLFNPGFNIGLNETIIVSLVALVILFFWASLAEKKIDLFKYWLAIFLAVFSFSHFHIQWLLWVAPFVVILVIKNPKLSLATFFLSTVAFAIPALYEDRSMTISLFRVYSTLYDLLPTPFSVLEKFYDPYNLQSILHSVLAGGNVVLIYKLFKKSA